MIAEVIEGGGAIVILVDIFIPELDIASEVFVVKLV